MSKNVEFKPRIYTIATAHLDTSWNWDLETTLSEYLPKTLKENFELFEKHPEYVFSFEGSYRYELIEEYYPELFERLKAYIEQGRWYVAGSGYENGDVNIPSPEALFRNFLFGNNYFYKKFGKRSVDIYLPDCFGFGYALPSVAAHSNLKGFITQKLVWSCAYGVPFDIGRWRGPDGAEIFAALDGRDYNSSLKNVRKHPGLRLSLRANTKRYSLPMTMILHGIGDRGGSPREESVRSAIKQSAENSRSKTDVIIANTDKIFRDIDSLPDAVKKGLPVWQNELVMTDHGVGGYTSRTLSKRWNRRGEQLALTAERAAAFADLFGVQRYPKTVLETAWKRIIAHQFHDDITGTSLVECYKRNWNDYMLSINQLAEEYRSAAGALAGIADSSFVKGTAVAVFNPLESSSYRSQAVTAKIQADGAKAVRVFDNSGNEVPSQVIAWDGAFVTVVFCAKSPGFGMRIYDIRQSDEPCNLITDVSVSKNTLENSKYRVKIDENGDISSIFDKALGSEILKSPIRMALSKFDGSLSWPSWELDYKEVRAKPVDYAKNPEISIIENGPARVALEIKRSARGSDYKQIVSLDSNGDIIKVFNEIEWRSLRTLLKTEFPLAVSNQKATFDLGLGVIERGNLRKKLYEVPAQMWADITDSGGKSGVSILSDSKYSWDKRDDNTLRLTGIYTPRAPYRQAQNLQDLGLNLYSFGIYSHSGSWQNGTQAKGMEFNEPMIAFVVSRHEGRLGSEASFCGINDKDIIIRAVKKAENSDEIVIRVNEGIGKAHAKVTLSVCGEILRAREIFACEEEIGTVEPVDGKLVFNIEPFEVKSFAIKVKPPFVSSSSVSIPLNLEYNADIVSSNYDRNDGQLPCGGSIPAEQFPSEIQCGGVDFKTGPVSDGEKNALACTGQELEIPEGCESLHIIAASFEGDRDCEFLLDGKTLTVPVQCATQRIAAWDIYSESETAYVKTHTLAWNTTHLHNNNGDEFGRQLYFFKYSFELPSGTKTLELPNDRSIILLAASATKNEFYAKTASPLFDTPERRECTFRLTKQEQNAAKVKKFKRSLYRLKFIINYAKRRLKKEMSQL